MNAQMSPVSKLSPATDASGTKVAIQKVSHLRGDLEAFKNNTITLLSARIQQRAHEDQIDGEGGAKRSGENHVSVAVGDDLRHLILKYQGGLDTHIPKHRETDLDHKMVCLFF